MNGKVSMKMQYKNNNQQKKLEIIIEIFRIIYWVKMVQHYYRYLNKKLQYYNPFVDFSETDTKITINRIYNWFIKLTAIC